MAGHRAALVSRKFQRLEVATAMSSLLIWSGGPTTATGNGSNYSGVKWSFELDGRMAARVERGGESGGRWDGVHRNVMAVQRVNLVCDCATCGDHGPRVARCRVGTKAGGETRFVLGVLGVRCKLPSRLASSYWPSFVN